MGNINSVQQWFSKITYCTFKEGVFISVWEYFSLLLSFTFTTHKPLSFFTLLNFPKTHIACPSQSFLVSILQSTWKSIHKPLHGFLWTHFPMWCEKYPSRSMPEWTNKTVLTHSLDDFTRKGKLFQKWVKPLK